MNLHVNLQMRKAPGNIAAWRLFIRIFLRVKPAYIRTRRLSRKSRYGAITQSIVKLLSVSSKPPAAVISREVRREKYSASQCPVFLGSGHYIERLFSFFLTVLMGHEEQFDAQQ